MTSGALGSNVSGKVWDEWIAAPRSMMRKRAAESGRESRTFRICTFGIIPSARKLRQKASLQIPPRTATLTRHWIAMHKKNCEQPATLLPSHGNPQNTKEGRSEPSRVILSAAVLSSRRQHFGIS